MVFVCQYIIVKTFDVTFDVLTIGIYSNYSERSSKVIFLFYRWTVSSDGEG